jgi:hypothetical protein
LDTSSSMGSEVRDRPSLRRGRLLVATAATALGVVALAVALPDDLRFLALVAAIAAGIGLERFRHSHFPTPPTLRETPEAWKYVLRYEIGYAQLVIASLLLAGAAAILLLSFDSGEDPASVGPAAEVPSAGPSPEIAVRTEPFGQAFTVAGARFDVTDSPVAAAAQDVTGRGERPVALTVAIRNLERDDFNPATLDYRLTDSSGALYGAVRSTAVGSDALVQRGTLPDGGRVDQELLFAVPRDARGLALEFEPAPTAGTRVRVRVPGSP